jgi:hypothetical protein
MNYITTIVAIGPALAVALPTRVDDGSTPAMLPNRRN